MTTFLLLSLLSAFDSFGQMDPASCHSLSSNDAIVDCLNNFALSQIQSQSSAAKKFQMQLQRSLNKYDLTVEHVQPRKLDEMFSLVLETGVKGEPCFDFMAMRLEKRQQLVERIAEQFREAALFLADFHARSWGHPVSLLFPIREVTVCASERSVRFEQRSLHLGLNPGHRPIKHFEIMEAWNSGHPLRRSELGRLDNLPLIGEKLRQFGQRKDYESLLRDKMADNWTVLNPIGTLRTTALYTLAEVLFKYKAYREHGGAERLSLNQKRDLMIEAVRGSGFTDADQDRVKALSQNDSDLERVFQLWQKKIFSLQNILLVLESSIGDRARQSANLHLVLRQIHAGVAVVNDKNISVQFEQMISSSIPVSRFHEDSASRPGQFEFTRTDTFTSLFGQTSQSQISVRARDVNAQQFSLNADVIDGGVVVDLIDRVIVNLQMPHLSPDTYRKVCLYQALQE